MKTVPIISTLSPIFLYLILVPWKTFGQLTEYEPNISLAGNNEIFRIKAVCTHVRHDPVYKVKQFTLKILLESNKSIHRLVHVWIVKRNYRIIMMEHIIVQNVN